VSLQAHADSWDDAFDPDVLATYLLEDTRRVLVLTQGADISNRKVVRERLLNAFNRLDRVTAVTVAALNGRDEDDQTLRDRAKAVPADVILIVRLFDEDEEPLTALGTFYERSGVSYAAFALQRGETLKRRSTRPPPQTRSPNDGEESRRPPSKGVTQEAIESVFGPEKVSRKPANVREYESRKLDVVTSKYSSRFQFRESKYGFRLSQSEALKRLGKSVLVDELDRRQSIKAVGLVGSGVALVGGVTLTALSAVTIENCASTSTSDGCARRNRARNVGIASGVGVAIGGLTGLALFGKYRTFPLSLEQSEQLVDEFNRELRRELDIDEGGPEESSQLPIIDIRIAPSGVDGSASIALHARF
jgi:hypothetical protein